MRWFLPVLLFPSLAFGGWQLSVGTVDLCTVEEGKAMCFSVNAPMKIDTKTGKVFIYKQVQSGDEIIGGWKAVESGITPKDVHPPMPQWPPEPQR